MPIETPLAKNWTLAMVPSVAPSLAEAETVVGPFANRAAPVAGDEILTVGAFGLTAEIVIFTLDEDAWLLKESVTSALRAKVPVAVGVQVALYGKLVSVPRLVPLTKNWTLAIVPAGALALPIRVIALLTG